MTFEEELVKTTKDAILKKLGKGDWINLGYHQQPSLAEGFLKLIYDAINFERVKALVLAKVEERIADRIFNALATELATDVKAVMSDSKARNVFRASIQERFKEICIDHIQTPQD